MFVRSAGEADLDAIKALLAETWHATYDRIYGAARVDEITGEWHSIASLRARLTRPRGEFIVADDGRSLGGMAFAAASADGAVVTLYQLYVRPACQGRGIGSELLGEIESSFFEARTLRLEVESQNDAAIRFYERRGFMPCRAAALSDASGEAQVLVMEKAMA